MGSYVSEAKAVAKVTLDGAEAGAQLKTLENSAKNLQKSLVDLYKAPVIDKAKIKETETALNEVEQTMKGINAQSVSYQRVLSNLSGSSLKELQAAYKKLAFEVKTTARNTDEWKQKASNLQKIDAEIKKVTSEMRAAGVQTKTLGNSFSNISSQLFGAAGLIGLFATLGSVIKGAFNTIKEFGKGISELEAITGASGDDLEFLKNKAKDLGATYGKSATEIVEAMKMVGSAKPELLENVDALGKVTEAVLTLSNASGMDLATATSSLTTIMNQFGHGAELANEDINILAAGSKFGAVEVDYLADAISKVGTVANAAGLTLQQTTAAMELFGEKGVKAEIAGTGFKSVLVELQKDTKNYTNGVFDLNKAIDNNQSISGDNIALQKKFGKEFFSLAQILLQNKDRFNELNTQVTGTNTAFEQAAIAMNNLSGDMDKLGGTWDKFVLSLEDGNGAISTVMRGAIQLFTDYINTLSKINDSSTTTKERFESWAKALLFVNPVLSVLNAQLAKAAGLWDKMFGDGNKPDEKASMPNLGAMGLAIETAKIKLAQNTANEKLKIETELSEEEQKALDKKSEAWKKANDDMLKASESLADQIKQMNIQMIADAQTQDEAEVEYWYEKEQEKINASLASKEMKDAALQTLEILHQDKLQEIQDNYLAIDLENQNKLLEEQKAEEAKQLLDAEELEKQKKDIADKARKAELDAEKKLQEEKIKLIRKKLQEAQIISGAFYDFITTAMDNELIAAGDNEERKKQILKKYADTQFAAKSGQIIASTALAIMQTLAELGPIAGPIASVIIGATGVAQLAMANTERQKMKGLASGGRFGVTRAQDGRNFSAEYGGNGFGYYSTPTVLIAEEGPEFVVSNKALKVPAIKRAIDAIDNYQRGQSLSQLNYSGLMNSMQKVRGFADGGFTQTTTAPQVPDNSTAEIVAAIIGLRNDLIGKFESVEVFVEIQKIRDAENTLSSLETEVRI